jgi:hypothetical protein
LDERISVRLLSAQQLGQPGDAGSYKAKDRRFVKRILTAIQRSGKEAGNKSD